MVKQQVKFYDSEKEMERLKILDGMRFMIVPNYTKLTALGNFEFLKEDKTVLRGILDRRLGE